MPNFSSYFFNQFSPVFSPYLNLLNLSTSWQLFAPDPDPPFFIEYKLIDQAGNETIGIFPPEKRSLFEINDQIRRVAASRFAVKMSGLSGKLFPHYLCRRFPLTQKIITKHQTAPLITMESAQNGRSPFDFTNKVTLSEDLTFCD